MTMRAVKQTVRSQSGVALLTTILLMLLMSSLLVGFILLINSGQKLSGINNDYGKAFYAAEAGMEKLTADLGTLFDQNYAPPTVQVNALENAPPTISGVTYTNADGTSGYTITSPNPVDANGNYTATVTQIQSGAYQGMTALATPYVMNVTARTTAGSEVKLQRTTQTVGIPMFQFGIFCDTDCSFFAGPNFNFGGRAHTNGNWWLASGSSLTMSDRVTAYKDVILYTLENGHLTSNGYTGVVNVDDGAGTRVLAPNQGSLTLGLGSPGNTSWPNISTGANYFAGNIRNGLGSSSPTLSTGATQLELGIVTLGSGTTQSIDVIRRPVVGESSSVTQERYFAQASMKILLSDNPQDITGGANGLPCTSSTAPYNLYNLTTMNTADPQTAAIKAALIAKGETFVPLPTSGANAGNPGTYSSANGYWTTAGNPTITGYIKIEIQTPPYNACNWTDVTAEVLGYGYVGKNANPTTGVAPPTLPALPAAEVGSLTAGQPGADICADGHAQAIIRLERIRDNPSTQPANPCAVTGTTINTTLSTDFWPNTFFDPREGFLRDSAPAGSVGTIPYSTMPTLGGIMQYVEIDVKNAARYLSGLSGGTGHNSYDSSNSPNDYVIYISDRRGNYYSAGTAFTGAWPPLSPSTHETGEYGFVDFVNPADTNGCPNKVIDTGENLAGTGDYYTYGQDPTHTLQPYNAASPWLGGYGTTNGIYNPVPNVANAWAPPPYAANGGANNCGITTPSIQWPGVLVVHAADARENPNFFFRRAVKLVNGKDLIDNLNTCPGNVTCGLTIAAENPVYIQGDYNCPTCAGNTFDARSVGASVIGDAVNVLSNNFNDVNTFINPYSQTLRPATTSYYRTAVVGGESVPFPQPSAWASAQDFGTDGGIHNFLRYIENWGGQTVNYTGSLVALYTSRQAVGTFKCCTTVYSAPSRNYAFDTNFLNPSLLPPRTPLFRDVNTTGFTQLLSPTQ
jgi:Tfp pilus assembly protein PilX